ncbi:MAG: hypothetical protein ACE14T_07435 [Syntrophales bacterium]
MRQTSETGLSPNRLLSIMGHTPADNRESFQTTVPWKSKFVSEQIMALFRYRKFLKAIADRPLCFGPFSFAADWQNMMLEIYATGPVKAQARVAASKGRNPDIFGCLNEWICHEYARLLQEFCGFFMKDGSFDREKAGRISSTPQGAEFITGYLKRFARLEKSYNSLGLTRLKAMKELVKCLIIVITEKPLEGEDLPFMKKKGDGSDALRFSEYLEESRSRLENLYRENAFDIETFSERAVSGKIGYSRFEFVEGSELHKVRLRHYILPSGIKPNGRVLYCATPLINKPEIFDLAEGKSVIEGMLKEGYEIYLIDHGDPGSAEACLGLDFYGKTVHDRFLDIIKTRHPAAEIDVMAYCMAGTLIMPYMARRAEERMARGEDMDIKRVALMAAPVKFDDGKSGHGPMRAVIRRYYDPWLMQELYGPVNIPPQVIEFGMREIQPGVEYTVASGFFERDKDFRDLRDSAPFLYWLTHGTRFPSRAHREWIQRIFIGNEICGGTYCLPSSNPALDGKPVNMNVLREAGVAIFDYRGRRDPIAPAGSCVASELWGQVLDGNIEITRGWLNRTIEKNIGHIFVVSKQLLSEYLKIVSLFFRGETVTT